MISSGTGTLVEGGFRVHFAALSEEDAGGILFRMIRDAVEVSYFEKEKNAYTLARLFLDWGTGTSGKITLDEEKCG